MKKTCSFFFVCVFFEFFFFFFFFLVCDFYMFLCLLDCSKGFCDFLCAFLVMRGGVSGVFKLWFWESTVFSRVYLLGFSNSMLFLGFSMYSKVCLR